MKFIMKLTVKSVTSISKLKFMLLKNDLNLDMKLVMKAAAKSVMNINMHINLSENTQIVFTKKIHIVFSVMS